MEKFQIQRQGPFLWYIIMYLSGFVLGKPHSPVSNLQTLIFQTPSYLIECLGLKGDKETLSKMYESMRSE